MLESPAKLLSKTLNAWSERPQVIHALAMPVQKVGGTQNLQVCTNV